MKIVIVLISLLLFSCKEEALIIDVSQTNNLAFSSNWAVISEPYASFHIAAKDNSAVNEYGRIGDVLEILSVKIDDNKNSWYRFENGWLPQSDLHIYTNKLQAKSAAEKLK